MKYSTIMAHCPNVPHRNALLRALLNKAQVVSVCALGGCKVQVQVKRAHLPTALQWLQNSGHCGSTIIYSNVAAM